MKSCYTCRPRRLKCDGATPACQKCIANGVVCLGYTKPVVWVGGAALKGHLQSWTNNHNAKPSKPRGRRSPVTTPSPVQAGQRDSTSLVKVQSPQCILTDPNFQDLSYKERYFVDYYEHALCPSLVFSDTTSNPFRRLVSMISAFPGISNATMALAACHQSHNLTGTPLLLQHKGSEVRRQESGEVAQNDPNSSPVINNERALEQVLIWKQRSIKHLSAALANTSRQHKSAAIATIFLLAILEMWETGWGIWYSHVEGAKNFIEDVHETSPNETAIDLRGMVASISVYETFGATVLRPGQLSKSLRARLNSYSGACDLPITGCPSLIMDAIDYVNSQNRVDTSQVAGGTSAASFNLASISGLLETLDRLDRFDAKHYANEAHSSLAPGHMSMSCFEHFCLAWKIAAKLYTTRVIFTNTNMQTHSLESSVDDLIVHCRIVTRECTGIKCFVWPVFIAGVECDNQVDRDWVSSALDQFWQLYLGANLKAVAAIMKILWQKKDAHDRSKSHQSWNWVRELYLLNVDLALGL